MGKALAIALAAVKIVAACAFAHDGDFVAASVFIATAPVGFMLARV